MAYRHESLESAIRWRYALPVSFGRNLKRLRLQRGLQSQEVAKQVGIKQGTYSDYERDRRGLPEGPTLLRFAKYFRVTVQDLLGGVDAEYDALVLELTQSVRPAPEDRPLRPSQAEQEVINGAPVGAAAARVQSIDVVLFKALKDVSLVVADALDKATAAGVTIPREDARVGTPQSRSRPRPRRHG